MHLKPNAHKELKNIILTDDNHAVDLDQMQIDMMNKIDYVHNNPVESGIVFQAEDYVYSSALDYTGNGRGLIEVTII